MTDGFRLAPKKRRHVDPSMCRLKRSTAERNKNRHDLFVRSKHSRAEHFQFTCRRFPLTKYNLREYNCHLPLKCQECQVSKYKKHPSTHVPKCPSAQLPMYRVTNDQQPFDQQRPTNHERQIAYHQLRTTNYAFQLHVSLHLLTLKFTYPYFCLPLNLFTFAFINAYISQVLHLFTHF